MGLVGTGWSDLALVCRAQEIPIRKASIHNHQCKPCPNHANIPQTPATEKPPSHNRQPERQWEDGVNIKGIDQEPHILPCCSLEGFCMAFSWSLRLTPNIRRPGHAITFQRLVEYHYRGYAQSAPQALHQDSILEFLPRHQDQSKPLGYPQH